MLTKSVKTCHALDIRHVLTRYTALHYRSIYSTTLLATLLKQEPNTGFAAPHRTERYLQLIYSLSLFDLSVPSRHHTIRVKSFQVLRKSTIYQYIISDFIIISGTNLKLALSDLVFVSTSTTVTSEEIETKDWSSISGAVQIKIGKSLWSSLELNSVINLVTI